MLYLFNQVAKAEDGSLKIDAETKKNNKTEDYYFEQETELSKLFNDAVTKKYFTNKGGRVCIL